MKSSFRETGQAELEYIKRRITDMGLLEFRITADATRPKDRPIILLANDLPPSVKEVRQGDNKVAEWVAYDVEAFRDDTTLVTRQAGDTPEALLLMDPYDVTGKYITSSTKGLDERGGPAVHFAFDRDGAFRFGQLTGENRPNPSTPDVYRHLGIILDKRLLSAPRIITRITDRGMISGGSMTEREVEHIIEVLNAGSLPAALNKTPISQEEISPTLGTETIEKRQDGDRHFVRCRDAVHGHLLPLRGRHRLHCVGIQFGVGLGADGADQGRVYAARPGRSGAHDRYGRRRQRVDLRADSRGTSKRCRAADGHSQRLQPGDDRDHRLQRHHDHYRHRAVLHRHGPGERVRRHADSGHSHQHVYGDFLLSPVVRRGRAPRLADATSR